MPKMLLLEVVVTSSLKFIQVVKNAIGKYSENLFSELDVS